MSKKCEEISANRRSCGKRLAPGVCRCFSKMAARANHYETLNVSRTSTYEEIRQVYLKLARKVHPDRGLTTSSKEKFQEINSAYVILSCPVLRAEHDRYLGSAVSCLYGGHHDQCTVKQNKCSLTLDIKEGLVELWLETLKDYYTQGETMDRGQQGVQIKTVYVSPTDTTEMGSISITTYKSTSRIHIQGSSYLIWMEEHLPVLETLVSERAKQDESLGKILDSQPRKSQRARQASIMRSAESINCAVCGVEVDSNGDSRDVFATLSHMLCTDRC